MLSSMSELLTKFLDWVLALLPHSPFQSFIKACSDLPSLGWLNWFRFVWSRSNLYRNGKG